MRRAHIVQGARQGGPYQTAIDGCRVGCKDKAEAKTGRSKVKSKTAPSENGGCGTQRNYGGRVKTAALCKEINPELEGFYVGDDVFDLGGFEDFFERGHHGVAVFDPGFEGFVGDFVVVYGEGAALADAFEAGADFLGVAVGVVADGAFLVEDFFAAGDGGGIRGRAGGILFAGFASSCA